jgi:hypothetical protein
VEIAVEAKLDILIVVEIEEVKDKVNDKDTEGIVSGPGV